MEHHQNHRAEDDRQGFQTISTTARPSADVREPQKTAFVRWPYEGDSWPLIVTYIAGVPIHRHHATRRGDYEGCHIQQL